MFIITNPNESYRVFHDPTVVRENPRKCCTVIAQLLHLQNTGQYMTATEGTEVFFGVTKLFKLCS